MNDFKDIIIDVNLNNLIIEKDYINKVYNNNNYNNVIKKYYSELSKEWYISKGKIGNLDRCNKIWCIDIYEDNQIKDFTGTYLCHDKFCNNCKKVKQASRMSKYIPYLEIYSDKLYHLTLTVPNVVGEQLRPTIEKMTKSFKSLIRYFTGNLKINGIDFSSYGYLGAVRSLEITFNKDSYHPHFHVAIAFSNLNLDKNIENKYSIDYTGKRDKRLFSKFEVLIQKIWYLLINNIKVTKNNIDKLSSGYSCIVDKLKENDYAEFFKYMIKETNEDNDILTYENFKILYISTEYLKQLQGYGCFYMINDKNLDKEVNKIYCTIKQVLLNSEVPKFKGCTPLELLNDTNYYLISRKKIYQQLKSIERSVKNE